MNLKKAGLITAGVLTAAAAVAPVAWAADGVTAPAPCAFVGSGDTVQQTGSVTGANPVNPVLQAPVAPSNNGTTAQCSTYGNHNGEGNGLGNVYHLPGNVEGELLAPAPAQ